MDKAILYLLSSYDITVLGQWSTSLKSFNILNRDIDHGNHKENLDEGVGYE